MTEQDLQREERRREEQRQDEQRREARRREEQMQDERRREPPPREEEILPRPMNEAPRRSPPRHHRKSVFWPIFLIGFGTVMLLSNLGVFPMSGWAILWRLWPLALIGLGIDVLIGRRSTGGAILAGLIILMLIGGAIGVAFFAQNIPVFIDWAQPAGYQHEAAWHPASGLESARVTIDWTSAPGELFALDDSSNLIEASVDYRGELAFDVEREGDHATVLLDSYQRGPSYGAMGFANARWEVGLSPNVALDLNLDAGSGAGDFDLAGLALDVLVLDVGSGGVDLTLPASSFAGEIDGGSGSLVIRVPDAVGLRLLLDDGSGSFNPGDRLEMVSGDADDDSVWETAGYARADYQIELAIDQGSGSLRITDD